MYYTNPLFGETACVPCVEVKKRICSWCGRFKPTRNHYGFESCATCISTSICSSTDIRKLIGETLPVLDRHLGAHQYGRVPVYFGELVPSSYASNPIGNAFIGGPDPYIHIQQGMPLGRAVGVLAHEYGHIALNHHHQTLAPRPGFNSRHIVIEEGFCEVMHVVALLSQSSDDSKFESFLLPANPDPVYGDGFRQMWPRALKLGSVAALLEELTGEAHPFRGPSPDSVDEDFVIPDDIEPLVEAGSGDRDKGILRGTAILRKDLPEDAPVGPRLRGTGLKVAERDSVARTPTIIKGTLRGSGLPDATKPSSDTRPTTKGTLRGKGLGKK